MPTSQKPAFQISKKISAVAILGSLALVAFGFNAKQADAIVVNNDPFLQGPRQHYVPTSDPNITVYQPNTSWQIGSEQQIRWNDQDPYLQQVQSVDINVYGPDHQYYQIAHDLPAGQGSYDWRVAPPPTQSGPNGQYAIAVCYNGTTNCYTNSQGVNFTNQPPQNQPIPMPRPTYNLQPQPQYNPQPQSHSQPQPKPKPKPRLQEPNGRFYYSNGPYNPYNPGYDYRTGR